MLNALLSVVAHDRLDTDVAELDADQVAAADEMLAHEISTEPTEDAR